MFRITLKISLCVIFYAYKKNIDQVKLSFTLMKRRGYVINFGFFVARKRISSPVNLNVF